MNRLKVELISHTPNPEKLVAAAAKLCYSNSAPSDLLDGLDTEKTEKFIQRLMNSHHETPLEHITFTFGIEGVSRALLAQITRHRVASFCVQSQRYCNMQDKGYVTPDAIYGNQNLRDLYESTMEKLWGVYEYLAQKLKQGYLLNGIDEKNAEKMAIEDARYVLPNACETNLVVTMNARELLHFFRLRCCNRAQSEIQDLADLMLHEVKQVAPIIFTKAGAPCLSGSCPEGKTSCGHPRKEFTYEQLS